MAKTSSIEKNKRRAQAIKQDVARRRSCARRARTGTCEEERFAATLKLAELPRNSAGAYPQPLRDHRPPARLLPQAQDEPHRAPRPRVQGRDPRPRQVELVRRGACQ